MSYGFGMGAKARANAARKTGHRAMMDRIAEENQRSCNAARVSNWSAPPCDCANVISFTMADGRVMRSCGEHASVISNMARSQ